jgi:hypothetical protein
VRASLADASESSGAARGRALGLAGVTFGGAAFLVLAGQAPEVGVNLFTAVLLLMLVASLLLARAIRRLD